MAAYHMAKANFSELHTNSKDQGQKFSYWKEGLVTRNTPVKYETNIPTHAKVIDKVKVLRHQRQTDRWTAPTQQKIYTLETLFIRA